MVIRMETALFAQAVIVQRFPLSFRRKVVALLNAKLLLHQYVPWQVKLVPDVELGVGLLVMALAS